MTAERPGVEIRLLGPVRAWRHGTEVALGPALRRAVLCVLALHHDRHVTREELVRAVWGESPPAGATGNLYTYVSALRQALEPERGRWSAGRLLTSGGGSYCLYLPGEAVDVARFDALRAAARRHRVSGDRDAELAALAAAGALWQGAALAGIPGLFAAAQRLRLAEMRLAVSERHAALLIEADRHADAVPELRRSVADHPPREAVHRDGRRTHDEVLGGTTALAPPDRLLVGRGRQLHRLRAAVTGLAAGRGGALWIIGEPGIGKSRLLAEGLRGVLTAGGRTGWGMGDELARRTPLGLLLDCLETAAPDRAVHAAVQQLRADAADPGRAAAAVERAVAVVRTICAGAPLMLVADSLHWADAATLRAWRALHPLTRELPLLLVASCRPEAAGSGPDRLRRDLAGTGTIPLTPLTDAEAAEVVRRRAPHLPATRVDEVVGEAAGNPSYLELLADGQPAALVAAIGAHLDRFGEPARQVLRALAFLGPCTLADVAVATGRPHSALRGAVAAPLAVGLLTAGPDGRLRFRHPVVARVLHDGTPAALRAMLHRAFAERITQAGGDPGDFRYPPGVRPVSPARG